jgi:site-specific recombinase XerD
MSAQELSISSPLASQLAPMLEQLAAQARDYVASSKAEATRRAYRADWNDFATWCHEHALEQLPAVPQTVSLYLAALADAGAKAATIQRRLAAISQAHQLGGHVPSPTADWLVRQVMAGIRRRLGTAPAGKAAIATAELRRLLASCDRSSLAGQRDAALLLLGFAGGFRRSELVALDWEDLEESEDGLRVSLRRSKSDQEGQGREVGIPFGSHPETCPVRALRAWRLASGLESGALWGAINRHDQLLAGRLSPQGVARIVKRACRRAGLDPERYAGHSLRSGLATAAAAGGAPERAIMRQTGHRSTEMVRRYIQAGTLFEENAAAYTGL